MTQKNTHALVASAVLLALTVCVNNANAFGLGKLIKSGEEKPAASSSESSTSTTQASSTATSEPIHFVHEKFGYVVDMPANWQKLVGDATSNMVMFNHVQTSNGGFTINATPMDSTFPTDTSLQAQEKSYQERLKRGELAKVYRKDFSDSKSGAVFKGYVTVETDKDGDPDIQRLQWIGYGKDKTYYNFTWSTDKSLFQDRLPEFEKILGAIQFTK